MKTYKLEDNAVVILKMSSDLCQADLHTPGNDITMSFDL